MVEIKHKLYRCRFIYAMSKLIMDSELWRRQNPDSSEFTCYDRSSGTRSRIFRVDTDIKIASNTKINQIMVSFTDHYNATFIDRFLSKIKIGKDSWYLNNSLLCKTEFSSTSKTYCFLLETQKTTTLQQVESWKSTKSSFTEDARTVSETIYFFKKIEFQYWKKTEKPIQ